MSCIVDVWCVFQVGLLLWYSKLYGVEQVVGALVCGK